MKSRSRLIFVILGILLASCTTPKAYSPPAIPKPPVPVGTIELDHNIKDIEKAIMYVSNDVDKLQKLVENMQGPLK
jgi:hypothetical protein